VTARLDIIVFAARQTEEANNKKQMQAIYHSSVRRDKNRGANGKWHKT